MEFARFGLFTQWVPARSGIMLSNKTPFILMRTRRSRIKRKPVRGTLVRYQDRIAEVLGDARGERVMIRSIHADGVERRTAVKWVNLVPLDQQLF